jgi:hypothetical protein
MKTKFVYLTVITVLLISCARSRYYPEIEDVLKQAGDNRSELEKVLKHYEKESADSLKLRAAEFLIANMPDKYSVEYSLPFENLLALWIRWDGIESRRAADEAYGSIEPVIKDDVKYITGDYLIRNIELAFKVWEEQPWGKDVPFDVFCEEILPYRVADEPLENWREKVLAGFAVLNRSFKTQDGITAEEACSQVNSQLPRFKLRYNMPEMNYSMLMTSTSGMCDEITALAVFAMRALGIPVSQDYIPKWPYGSVGHTWNSVYSSNGKHFSFMGTEFNPEWNNNYTTYSQISKVYRRTFAKQKNIEAGETDIPSPLQNQYMADVTDEYLVPVSDSFHGRGIEIPLGRLPAKNTGYAWLAAAGDNAWNIVGWGKTVSGTVHFGAVGRNILYLPVYYENGMQIPANYPFTVNSKDSVRIFKPDTNTYCRLKVREIFPAENDLIRRMKNGIFEGANQSDFSDAKVLYTVKEISGVRFHTAKIRNPGRYRYVRYVSPKNSNCNVAEIKFFNDKGESLQGEPVGTPGSFENSPMTTCDKAFDGDISTYYNALKADGSWTGLDLGEEQTIAEIHYFPRNEGNIIFEGHTYELFYFNNNGWQLFDKQTAASGHLDFRVPVNTLFYLKNVTTGKFGKWFTTDANGKQLWMHNV